MTPTSRLQREPPAEQCSLPFLGSGAAWVPDSYVWLVWSASFVAVWALFFLCFPRLRRVLWWVAVCTTPFGFTEAMFVGWYWNPPSVMAFGGSAPLDIESFLFCFGLGGVAAVLYNIVLSEPIQIPAKTVRQGRHQQWYVAAIALPFVAYLPLMFATTRPLWAGVGMMLLGAALRILQFPSLRAKTCIGGVLLLAYYAIFLALLCWISPGYIGRVWLKNIPGPRVLNIPLAEPCFAWTMGMFWSGIYEQVIWIFTPPDQTCR